MSIKKKKKKKYCFITCCSCVHPNHIYLVQNKCSLTDPLFQSDNELLLIMLCPTDDLKLTSRGSDFT